MEEIRAAVEREEEAIEVSEAVDSHTRGGAYAGKRRVGAGEVTYADG